MRREEYIKAYSATAVEVTKGTSLFPSLLIAQAILESGSGASRLTREFHNHFGIKNNKAWKGKVVNMVTGEVLEGKEVNIKALFRAYGSARESFEDRNNFLIKNLNYVRSGVFTSATPEDQAEALQRAGYATDPHYAEKLITIIRFYNLKNLDPKSESK